MARKAFYMYKSVVESLEERCKFRSKEFRCKPRSTSFRFQGRRAKSAYGLRKTTVKMERRNRFSSVSRSSFQKFDGKNYNLKDWAFEMELLFTQERAWSIVSGEEKSLRVHWTRLRRRSTRMGRLSLRESPRCLQAANTTTTCGDTMERCG
jgi:hypothetical protein